MARIMYFVGEEDHKKEMTPAPESDSETLEFESGEVANVEVDELGYVTVYFSDGHFYLVFSKDEWLKISHPTQV